MDPILKVEDLCLEFWTPQGHSRILSHVSYHVCAGELVGIVGESGCGKSMSLLCTVQLQPPQAQITAGKILFQGKNLLQYQVDSPQLRRIRGKEISMIFQNPMTALNPVLTVGEQIAEVLRKHLGLSETAARQEALRLMNRVKLEAPEEKYGQFPFQLSGGMCQRIMIAMAIACRPRVLIADEATTALDVTTQQAILRLLVELAEQEGIAVIFVTHNLGIVAQYAGRIYVMYAGHMVEQAPVTELFAHPGHPYTQGLLGSIPKLNNDKRAQLQSIPGAPPDLSAPLAGCPFLERCRYAQPSCQAGPPEMVCTGPEHQVRCRRAGALSLAGGQPGPEWEEREKGPPILQVEQISFQAPVYAGRPFRRKIGTKSILEEVSFSLRQGETVGVVGESGCGKTTLARCLLGVCRPSRGRALYRGEGGWVDLAALDRRDLRRVRPELQMVFQDSVGCLNPHMTIGEAVVEPLVIHGLLDPKKSRTEQAAELLRLVGLNETWTGRYPAQLSGGQCQRVGIARALATRPKVLLCDEAVSALDVSVQAAILNLLKGLQRELNLSYLFIAHDISVVRHISDSILVMYRGRVLERGSFEQICGDPKHPYTAHLIQSVPVPEPSAPQKAPACGEPAEQPEGGCVYYARCPIRGERCRSFPSTLRLLADGRACACLNC